MTTYRRPREGEALDATALEADLVTSLEDLVNDVVIQHMVRRALRRDHVPGPITTDFDFNGTNKTGLSVMGASTGAYNNFIAVLVPSAGTFDWQAFNASGTKPPYGIAATWGAGWRIVDQSMTASTVYAAERRFPATRFTDHHLLVNFSAELIDLGSDPNADANATTEVALVAIGIEDNAGRRFVLLRTIRAFARESFVLSDIGTFTRLTPEDVEALEGHHQLTPGSATVVAAFAVVASQTMAAFPFIADDVVGRTLEPGARLGNYNFDILPIPVGGL